MERSARTGRPRRPIESLSRFVARRSMRRASARRRSTISSSTASFRTMSMPPCSPRCRSRPTTGRCRGRSKGHDLADGTHTRVKIDLFPEYIRALPPEKRAVWDVVGRALCSQDVKQAFVRRLAPGLERRFGAGLRQGRHVSDPDPDARHPGLPDHAAYRYALEGHHRPALPAARRRPRRTSAPSSTSGCRTAACRSARR